MPFLSSLVFSTVGLLEDLCTIAISPRTKYGMLNKHEQYKEVNY